MTDDLNKAWTNFMEQVQGHMKQIAELEAERDDYKAALERMDRRICLEVVNKDEMQLKVPQFADLLLAIVSEARTALLDSHRQSRGKGDTVSEVYADIEVETPNPTALDETVQRLGPAAVVVGSWNGKTCKVRVFGDPGFIKFAIESQGYGRIVERK